MKVMIFDVGGTEIKYSVMDDAMNRYESGSIPTPSRTFSKRWRSSTAPTGTRWTASH